MNIFDKTKYRNRQRKTNAILVKLADEVGFCAAGIADILKEEYDVPNKDIIILENSGLLLARIHFEGGLNNDEIMRTIALFFSKNCKHGEKKHLEHLSRSFTFYNKLFFQYKERDLNSLVLQPIICYNLIKPGTWETDVSCSKINMLKVAKWWIGIKNILLEMLPGKINPLLDQLDKV